METNNFNSADKDSADKDQKLSRRIYTGMTFFIIIAAIICACLILFTPAGYRSFTFSFGGGAVLRQTTDLEIGENTVLTVSAYAENINFYESNSGKLEIKEYYRSRDKRAQIAQSGGRVDVAAAHSMDIVLFGFFGAPDRIEIYLPENYVAEINATVSSGNIRSDRGFAGKRVELTASSGEIAWRRLDAAEINLKASSGNIRVEEAQGQVRIQANSGNIKLDRVSGSLEARVSSGNITVREVSGDFTAKAGSGNITADRVTGFVTAEATSGVITVAGLTGGADADASSGNVRLTVTALRDDINARANSGNVRITLPEDSAFTFTADTGSGRIDTDFDDNLSYNKKGNSAHGMVGDGPRYAVAAEAGSGNVKVTY